MSAEAVARALLSVRPESQAPLTISSYQTAHGVCSDEYVQRAVGGTFCHLSGWQRVVERTWGHANHSLLAMRDGQVVGVLPLFHVQSRVFGSMLISSPNAVYGGVVADDQPARLALLQRAKQVAEMSAHLGALKDVGELMALVAKAG